MKILRRFRRHRAPYVHVVLRKPVDAAEIVRRITAYETARRVAS